MRSFVPLSAVASLGAILAVSASAAPTLFYQDHGDNLGTTRVDQDYEFSSSTSYGGTGFNNSNQGFLKSQLGLPDILVNNVAQTTVLPQLERAVGQIRDQTGGNGLCLPQAATGIPNVANASGTSSGVFAALTNASTMGNGTGGGGTLVGSVPNNTRGVAAVFDFEFKRTITSGLASISFTITKNPGVSQTVTTWTSAPEPALNKYYSEINAFQLRLSSGNSTLTLSDLLYTDASVNDAALGSLLTSGSMYEGQSILPANKTASVVAAGDATAGQNAIRVFTGVAAGDFSLRGRLNSAPNASTAWNFQIKGLTIAPETVVPEPATVSTFLGLGVLGVVLARRRGSRR